MARLDSVCPDCGGVFTRDGTDNRAACKDCRPADDGAARARRMVGTTTERGYGSRWQRLARKARALQPFCSDCGATDDLTGDHSIEAWKRHDAGKTVRLQDIDVVCRRCNSERGAARGGSASDRWRNVR